MSTQGWIANQLEALRYVGYGLITRTPLALPLLFLMVGIHCSPYLDAMTALGMGIILVVLWYIYIHKLDNSSRRPSRLPSYILILGILSLLGASVRQIADRDLSLDNTALPQRLRVVTYSSSDEPWLSVRLLDSALEGKIVRLQLVDTPSICVGDTLEVVPDRYGSPWRARYSRADTLSGASAHLRGRCVGYTPLKSTKELITSPKLLSRHLQAKLVRHIKALLGGREAESNLIVAIALGYLPYAKQTRDIRENFAHSGSAHILAVSGFHLGVIASILSFILLRLFRLSSISGIYLCCMLVGIWSFALITGSSVATIRASLMLSLYLFGRTIGRRPRLPNILACTAFIQLLASPHELYSVGFALSYAAVLSIYLLYAPLYELVGLLKNPIVRWLWQALCLSLSAQVLVLPICLYYWGTSSLAFVWSCIPMALLTSIILPLSWLVLGLSTLPLPLDILIKVMHWLADIMLAVSTYLGQLPYTIVSQERYNSGFLLLALLLLLPAWYIHQWYQRHKAEQII